MKVLQEIRTKRYSIISFRHGNRVYNLWSWKRWPWYRRFYERLLHG